MINFPIDIFVPKGSDLQADLPVHLSAQHYSINSPHCSWPGQGRRHPLLHHGVAVWSLSCTLGSSANVVTVWAWLGPSVDAPVTRVAIAQRDVYNLWRPESWSRRWALYEVRNPRAWRRESRIADHVRKSSRKRCMMSTKQLHNKWWSRMSKVFMKIFSQQKWMFQPPKSQKCKFRSHFGFRPALRWSPLKNLDKPGAGSVVTCWPSSEAMLVHGVAQHVVQNLVNWTSSQRVENQQKSPPKKPSHNWFSATTLSSLGGGFQFQPTDEGQIKAKATNQVWTAPICRWFASFPPLRGFWFKYITHWKKWKAQKPQEDHRPIEHKWWSMHKYATIIVQNVGSCN